MTSDTQSAQVTPVGGNVFSDLGFDPEEAMELRNESQRKISEKIAITDALVDQPSSYVPVIPR